MVCFYHVFNSHLQSGVIMKKAILPAIIIVAALLTIVFTAGIIAKDKANRDLSRNKLTLPAFNFYSLDSVKYASEGNRDGLNTCVIYFDPECEHCEYETKLITQHINQFATTRIFMISNNSTAKIKAFAQKFNLYQHKQIRLLWDKEYKFYTWFGHAPIPSTYIYNKDNRLVKEYHGETKIEAITSYLK
jgi:peroxiredoxin